MIKLLRAKKWQKIIKKSNLFDIKFYLFAYPDVRGADMDPIEHFIRFGAYECRNPSNDFDTSFYLEHYPDVRQSGVNPLVHYILFGKEEGRSINKDICILDVKLNYSKKVKFIQIKSKTVCLFAHYDRDDVIDPYVINYLKSIKTMSESIDIVFITVCENICDKELHKINKLASVCIVRKNIGYDFGSWKVGIDYLSEIGIKSSTIIMANDSVYGNFYDLREIYNNMQNKKYDIWGMTDSHSISYHLQSYFLVINSTILKSNIFLDFWKNFKVITHKQLLIKEYEVGMSRIMAENSFKLGVYAPINKVSDTLLNKPDERLINLNAHLKSNKFNVTHLCWDVLIEDFRYPFIKIELLRDNPMGLANVYKHVDLINKYSKYDLRLIKNHLKRISNEG